MRVKFEMFSDSLQVTTPRYHKNAYYKLIQVQNGKPCHKATVS